MKEEITTKKNVEKTQLVYIPKEWIISQVTIRILITNFFCLASWKKSKLRNFFLSVNYIEISISAGNLVFIDKTDELFSITGKKKDYF